MKPKTGSEYVPWLMAGVGFLGVLLIFAWYAHQSGSAAQQLASKASRVDLVERMQRDLAAGSEAEKSAVLAPSDADSVAFANQARAATAEVVLEQSELGALLASGGTPPERDLMTQLSEAFGNLQRVDDEVLALAVKNTNLKAYGLLFGPAADTLAEMDAALDRVVTKYASANDAKQVMDLAFRARISALRIQALLAPHIAEENDAKMDRMESSMTKEEAQIRRDLDGLAGVAKLARDADVAIAASRFVRYEEIKSQIVPLSRENTNVRSLTLSLTQKRKAMIATLDTLSALRQEIVDEPIAGVAYGRGAKSRR